MEKERKKEIVFVLMVVCGVVGVCMHVSSYYEQVNSFEKIRYTITEVDRYYMMRDFDYMRGLFLIPEGLFFVFLLVYLDVPSFSEAGIVLYTDLKKKFSKDLKKR